jgi:ATP-dependent helicase/nuclease subunit A
MDAKVVTEPTPEQEAAITTEGRALLVEAGAGTGKTWVLVQRFIHLLDRHPNWPLDSIVAITFTEKATREMRSRIRAAVEDQAGKSPPGSHWRRRVLELERLQVATIHGLCARILRENAITAGIDPHFAVLDQQDADLLKEDAVRQTLAELVEQDSPALELLAVLQVRDLRDEMLSLLGKRGTVGRLFNVLPDERALLAQWADGLAAMREAIWQARLREVPALGKALAELPHVTVADSAAGDKLAGFVRQAQEGCTLLENGDLPGAVECWLPIKLNVGRAANWGGQEALQELKGWLKALREAAEALMKSGAAGRIGTDDEAAARLLQQWRALWVPLTKTYDRLKEERQALDFDDLERLAERLLAREPRSDRLLAYMDGIHHLMVDEFQDTNETQGRIVYALANPGDGGRLFVVGDAKQSIYRFRQAQVSVFNRTGREIERVTGEGALSLSRSFRSQESLVAALNELFDRVLCPVGKAYEDFEARPGRLEAQRPAMPGQGIASPVEMILLPSKDAAGQKVLAEDGRLWEAQLLAQRLLSLQAEGFQVWDKGQGAYRRFSFGDAGVLFRATTSLPLYEEVFKAAGLPYLTVSGRGYYDRPEVRDLIALLGGLHAPGDDLSLATALRSPLFSLSDETLYRLRWRTAANERAQEPVPFARALETPPPTDQEQQVASAGRTMKVLWEMAGRVDVWELLRETIDRTGYEAALIMGEGGTVAGGTVAGGRQVGNLKKFLALARERGSASLSDFLRRLQDLQAREAREGEAPGGAPEAGGAVQLMSIHAAKGLEFPVVAVADLGRSGRGGWGSPRILHDPAFGLACKRRDENGEWQKPASYAWAEWQDGRMEEAESKRLLYVACTRAADLLILTGKSGGGGSWLHQLLEGWGVEPAGEATEVVQRDGYSLRVNRPMDRPEPLEAAAGLARTSPGMAEMPALAQPLSREWPAPLAVTDLVRRSAVDGEASPEMRPAVIRSSGNGKARHAPKWLIGRVVHHALADWQVLSLPRRELESRLELYARREGAGPGGALRHAVATSRRMLERLRGSALYEEIASARKCYGELPFTMETAQGLRHGKIDLLYQDGDGVWRLIDWKTEWSPAEMLLVRAQEHQLQVAVYALAAERLLGVQPAASVCFLDPELILHTYPRSELSAEQGRI